MRKYMGRFIVAMGLVATFMPSVVAAQMNDPIQALKVVDATGKKVGTWVGITTNANIPVVALEISGIVFVVQVRGDRFEGREDSAVLHFEEDETNNCAGTVLLDKPGNWPSAVPLLAITGPNNTVHLVEPDAIPQPTMVLSALDQAGNCFSRIRNIMALTTQEVVDLFSLFTPPFTVQKQTAHGPRVKVKSSSFQYQADQNGDRWIFRYDYLRQPPQPQPSAHLHVRGSLLEPCLSSGSALEDIHFPTQRVSLEAVIRLLIEQFGVHPNESVEIWRPVLAESEAAFLGIAHQSLSGPDR